VIAPYKHTPEPAARIAERDVLANFAERAIKLKLSHPKFNNLAKLELKEVRHLAIDQNIQDPFIPIDTVLSQDTHTLHVLTG
ncbi:hypothetical protein NAI75_10100, partial [Francisella tularensis subsp. holarctica]|uniref:hypothetical protein n=1 Tax=Francisella tularensis TaxID=263 RepID=UPI002381B56A